MYLECTVNQPIIRGDRSRIQQLFSNILSNAIKFSHPNGVIKVSIQAEKGELILTCRDQGIGIDPVYLPHVFERFSQADTSVSRQYGGLGIGLAIAQGLVKLHRGAISVSSEGRNKGAVFTIRFPMA